MAIIYIEAKEMKERRRTGLLRKKTERPPMIGISLVSGFMITRIVPFTYNNDQRSIKHRQNAFFRRTS